MPAFEIEFDDDGTPFVRQKYPLEAQDQREPIASAPAGADTLVASVHLGPADLSTLFSAPPEIIAAPGAGKKISVIHCEVEWVPGVAPYLLPRLGCFYDDGIPTSSDNQTGAMLPSIDTSSLPYLAQSVWAISVPTRTITRTTFENHAIILTGDMDDGFGADPIHDGQIVTVSPTPAVGGSGYEVGDTGVVVGAGSSSNWATYVVDSVDGDGVVLTFHLTSLGTGGYDTVEPAPTLRTGSQPGSGDEAFAITVTEVHAPDSDLYVNVLYRVLTLH